MWHFRLASQKHLLHDAIVEFGPLELDNAQSAKGLQNAEPHCNLMFLGIKAGSLLVIYITQMESASFPHSLQT